MPEGVGGTAGAAGSPTTGGNQPSTGGGNAAVAEPTFSYGGGQPISGDRGETRPSEDAIDAIEGESGSESEEFDDFGAEDFDDAVADPDIEDKPSKLDYKKLTEQLKSQDPKIAKAAEKQLKRAVMENQRFKEFAASPEALRDSMARIDAFGGLDGIEKEMQEWNSTLTKFQSGDPAVIDEWFKENPAGMAKLMPTALNKLRETNPQAWNHEMSKVFMATVNQGGALEALASLADVQSIKDSPEAMRALQKFFGVVKAVDDFSQNAPKQDDTIKDQTLTKREQALTQKEATIYRQTMNSRVEPVMSKVADNALARVLKGRNLTAEAKAELRKDIFREFAVLNAKDETFKKNANALYTAKDIDKFVRFVKSRADTMMPRAAARVWRKYTGITGLSDQEKTQRAGEGQSRREAGAGGAGGNFIKTAQPNKNDIDWGAMRQKFGGRDGAEDAFMSGKYLKKGDSKNEYRWR